MGKRLGRRDFLRAGAAGGAGLWLGGVPVPDLLSRVPSPAASNPSVPPAPLPDDPAYLSIAQASREIAAGRLTPLDLVDACLRRIERYEPLIGAWVFLRDPEEVRAEARAAGREIASDGPRSPLHGIPIGHKDLYDVEGIPTRAGSRVRADVAPAARDAPVVARLRRAGAIVLGKTNTHEFAYGVWTPPTSNPWDTTRVPGGSSGGSAAALAAGMCLGATGSDTGGSLRIPSSLCGTFAIKPTFGRVPKSGVVPLAWSLDHAGPMTRTAGDAALMLNVMAGYDASDPTSVRAPVPDFGSALGATVAGMRVGVPDAVLFDGADEDTRLAIANAADTLRTLGAEVVDVDAPASQRVSSTAYLVVQLTEPLAAHEHYLRVRPQDYQAQTQVLFGLGGHWTAQQYLRAQRLRTINIAEWLEVFARVDAVLSPAVPHPAPTKQEAQASGSFELVNYTSVFDFNGFPSLSVNAGFSRTGLPIGAMLSARPFDEARLLGLAAAFERAVPPVHPVLA